jgi:hypothetical protein
MRVIRHRPSNLKPTDHATKTGGWHRLIHARAESREDIRRMDTNDNTPPLHCRVSHPPKARIEIALLKYVMQGAEHAYRHVVKRIGWTDVILDGERHALNASCDVVLIRLLAKPIQHPLGWIDSGDSMASQGELDSQPAGARSDIEEATSSRCSIDDLHMPLGHVSEDRTKGILIKAIIEIGPTVISNDIRHDNILLSDFSDRSETRAPAARPNGTSTRLIIPQVCNRL